MIQGTPNPAYVKYNVPAGAVIDPEKQIMLKQSLIQTKDNFVQSTDENPAVKAAQNTGQDPKVLAGAVGIWVLLKSIVKPINKAISGKYEDSLLGKIGSFGDRVSDALHLDAITSKTNGISKWAKNNRLTKYFSSTYKTTPKNAFASSMANGTLGELANDASSVIKACQDQKIDLTKFFNKADLDDILKEPLKNTDKIINGLKNAGAKDFVEFGGKFKLPFIGDVSLPVFKRKVYFTELANKLTAVGKKGPQTVIKNGVKIVENAAEAGAKSGLGKNLSKGFLRTLEGLTNGMAGGPAAILIQAFCFAQATKAAIQAPKGEKLSTFTESVFQDLGYYLVGSSSINLLSRAGGNKYRGMSEAALKEYKTILKATNESIANGANVDVKLVKRQLKDLLKGKSKTQIGETFAKQYSLKFWEKPLKFVGKLFGSGLDKIDPVIKSSDNFLVKTFKKLGSKAKGFPGGFGRFALAMFVITPALVKPIVKLSHLLFGRPTKSVLDKEDTKTTAPIASDPNAPNTQPGSVNTNGSSSNYLDMFANQPKPQVQNPVNPAAPINQQDQPLNPIDEIPARKIKKDKDSENNSNEPVRTYVPSSVPTEFAESTENYSQINDIMRKAEVLEREVLKNV